MSLTGASFSYHPDQWFWEAVEVRAFGLFLSDLVDRLAPESDSPESESEFEAQRRALAECVASCVAPDPAARPRFSHVETSLRQLMARDS